MRALFISFLFALVACTQNDSFRDTDGVGLRDEAVHALMAERISTLYQRIEELAFDQNRSLPELEQDRRRAADAIAESARSLSEAAVELTALSTLPETASLTASTRQQFQTLSARLQQSSDALARAAEEMSSARLASGIVGIQATCSTCHDLYRGR